MKGTPKAFRIRANDFFQPTLIDAGRKQARDKARLFPWKRL